MHFRTKHSKLEYLTIVKLLVLAKNVSVKYQNDSKFYPDTLS
jgi:hypothetical protein